MTTDAYYTCLTVHLGLSARDLTEIGGWKNDRTARDMLAGNMPFPPDVRQALDDLDDDVGVMVDELIADVEEGAGALFIFRSTQDLRRYFPQWPGRGKAAGGFTAAHRIAALTAQGALSADGIDVDILFFSREEDDQQ